MSIKISVCMGRSCLNNFSKDVLKEAIKISKCQIDTFSDDGNFYLRKANCLNNCHHGPSVNFNTMLMSKVTPKEIKKLIQAKRLNDDVLVSELLKDAEEVI